MAAARFCSECGERLKLKRASITPFCSFCRHCSTPFRRIRLGLIAIPCICALIGFAFGRYTSSREPFYFIGSPVDLSASRVGPSAAGNNSLSSPGSAPLTQREQPVISSGAADSMCGAQTKSGKPCRRKVKGGGYCWQHRDKQSTQQNGAAR
jgi:hypothetical protein